jgi:hypothetical protein
MEVDVTTEFRKLESAVQPPAAKDLSLEPSIGGVKGLSPLTPEAKLQWQTHEAERVWAWPKKWWDGAA